MGQVENKVAIVTGGSTGIGLATAKALCREGAKVVITGRNQQSLDEAAVSIEGEVLAIANDAGSLDDIDSLLKTTKEQFGAIDIMFFNAGPGGVAAPIAEMTEEAFDRFMNINFKGPYFTIQKSLPYLAENASIIFCSSISNAIGQPGLSVYAAAKAAQRAMVRIAATELGPQGIRFNVVSPGFIDTPIFEKSGVPAEMRAEIKKMVEAQTSLGRMGRPEDIAEAVVYLASPASGYVIGAEIIVDGGYSIPT
jgi:NAD(P)-dependent dehydrogenase (short-subunit alcohol dehydrogenase family)